MSGPGWPDDYDDRKRGVGCALCASIGGAEDADTVTIAVLGWSEVRLQRRSRLPGYCVVVWRGRHVAEVTELTADEAAGYWGDVASVGRAIEAACAPVKLNLFTLGNLVPHLHTHVVPRYPDDPLPGGLIPWDDMFAPEPSGAHDLQVLADRIVGHLER